MKLPLLALSMLWFQSLNAMPRQEAVSGIIRGVVVNATTGDPIPAAQITLIPDFGPPAAPGSAQGVGPGTGRVLTGVLSPNGTGVIARGPDGTPIQSSPPPTTMTGNAGQFTFENVKAGAYRLIAGATGYAPPRLPTLVRPGAGEPADRVTIRLVQTGSVSGHILDESGRPAIDAPVQLFRVTYTPEGKVYPVAGSATADDRGYYRMYGIAPGRYYISIGQGAGPLRRPGQPTQGPIVLYSFSFYPGVTDIDDAMQIEVKSGGESIIDMNTVRTQLRSVKGRVVDPAGQPPATVDITLSYQNFSGGSGSFGGTRNYDPATGQFTVTDVPPGQYIVRAVVPNYVSQRPGTVFANGVDYQTYQAIINQAPSGEVPVFIGNADVEGLTLILSTGVSVPGHITLEGPQKTPIGLDRVRVTLQAISNGRFNPSANSPSLAGPISPDGTFRFDNVREGEYKINVFVTATELYVKSATFNGADGMNVAFRFSGGRGEIEAVIRTGAARLAGTVSDGQGRAVAGAQVVLVPAQADARNLFKTSVSDPNGQFNIAGIPPGEYKLFSWESLEPNAYFDPEFLGKYEQRATRLNIPEGAAQSVQIKVIPVQ